jgi:hypothetical protein
MYAVKASPQNTALVYSLDSIRINLRKSAAFRVLFSQLIGSDPEIFGNFTPLFYTLFYTP